MHKALPDSLRSAAVTLVTGLALVALGGCGAPDELPPPGADGLVVMHWWDEKNPAPPAYLQAQRVAQLDAKFGKLEFSGVMMRLPGSDGVVYVTAPYAVYQKPEPTEEASSASAHKATTTPPPEGSPEKNGIVMGADPKQPIDGPVRFIGVWSGELIMGRAAQAVFEGTERRMRLDQVEFTVKGLRQRTAWAAITQHQTIPFGELLRMPDAPALTAALAALPSPLVLPPMRQ